MTIRRYSPDGGPIPNNVRASQRPNPLDDHKSQWGLKRGYVQKAVFPGDDDNITGELEYLVSIAGQLYPGVLDMSSAGSIYNNHLRVRRGVGRDSVSDDGLAQNTFEEKKDGEAVWCLFIDGDGDVPIILRSATHPRVTENANYKKPTADDGEFERYEQNGFEFLITNDGTLTVKLVGVNDPTTGEPSNPDAVDSVFTLDSAGNLSYVGSTGTTLNVDNENDALFLICDNGDSVEISKANGFQTSTPAGGGCTISQKSGQVDITAGQGLTVTANGAPVTLTGPGGAELNLAAGKPALGNGAIEIFDALSKDIEQEISSLDAIIQNAPTIVSTAVGPGVLSPAVVTALTSAKATLTTLKQLIDSNKGSL